MDYQTPCQYSIRLIDKLKSLDTKNVLDLELINKAIYWAKKYHGDQKRKSGEPYYTHPLEVAYMISNYKLKTDVIVASILHDIIEDTEVTAGMIVDNFSYRIAQMVDRLTRDRPNGTKLSVEQILNNAYENADQEVMLIKLMDRMHNMETIATLKSGKRIQTSKETLTHFIIIATYLSISQVRRRFIELCYEELNITQTTFLKSQLLSQDNSPLLSPAFQNVLSQVRNQ